MNAAHYSRLASFLLPSNKCIQQYSSLFLRNTNELMDEGGYLGWLPAELLVYYICALLPSLELGRLSVTCKHLLQVTSDDLWQALSNRDDLPAEFNRWRDYIVKTCASDFVWMRQNYRRFHLLSAEPFPTNHFRLHYPHGMVWRKRPFPRGESEKGVVFVRLVGTLHIPGEDRIGWKLESWRVSEDTTFLEPSDERIPPQYRNAPVLPSVLVDKGECERVPCVWPIPFDPFHCVKVKEGQVDDSGYKNTLALAFWRPYAKEGQIWGLFEGEKYLLDGHHTNSLNSKVVIRQGKLASCPSREFLVEQIFVYCQRHHSLALACRGRYLYVEGSWHVTSPTWPWYLFAILGYLTKTSNPK